MTRVALGLWAALALAHLLGWREDVSFLSGTAPGTTAELAAGLTYALVWFSAVLVAPVLLVSGLALRALEAARGGRALRRRGETRQ